VGGRLLSLYSLFVLLSLFSILSPFSTCTLSFLYFFLLSVSLLYLSFVIFVTFSPALFGFLWEAPAVALLFSFISGRLSSHAPLTSI
jgi:hypothetical protein